MNHPISDAYRQLWSGLERRIAQGIRTYRTAQAEVQVVDAAGRPVPGAVVSAEQVGHLFHFGANSFLLDGYEDAELNRRYEQRFLQLFNAATVALYWNDLEPEQGKPRFAADSRRIWRRPPTDRAVSWCREHGLLINGHPLVWHHPTAHVPAWWPQDPGERARLSRRRIAELAGRYGGQIQRWDVLNERLESYGRPAPAERLMYPGYDIDAFRAAQEALPPEAILMINDYFQVWNPSFPDYRRLILELEDQGARIDAIGLQMHNFTPEEISLVGCAAIRFRGDDQLAALDRHLELGRPLHVSEVTMPQPCEGRVGEEAQAEMVRNLYRLWFSHPGVHGITWWNLADGGAFAGEDKVLSGLIDRNHEPKAAFHALDRLINQEWRTRTGPLTAGAEGCVRFRGFKGAYRLTAEAQGRRTSATATHATDGTIRITLP